MELRDLLELGAKKAGSLTALGKILDVSQPNMSHAKAHKARLPADAVVRLSDYLGIDLRIVMAANELATEKKEEKRRFWSPFVEHARAAAVLVAIASATNFVTPTPAEASVFKVSDPDSLYYVKSRIQRVSKKRQLFGLLELIHIALVAILRPRIPKMEPV